MSEGIINDVNVSECCFYNNGKCNNPNGMACNCINNAVGYFKELKRLQAENEKKDKLLKWLITQQYYIIPKNLKQKIREVLG